MSTDKEALIEAAKKVRANAYAPFSSYLVGAAVSDDTGTVHVGCNVENAAYPEGICAEANAIGSMVAAGGRRIVAIAVVGGVDTEIDNAVAAGVSACTPCGGCRQRILEFSDADTVIYLHDADERLQAYGIEDLLPSAFRLTSPTVS